MRLAKMMTCPYGRPSGMGNTAADFWYFWRKDFLSNSNPKRLVAMNAKTREPCAMATISKNVAVDGTTGRLMGNQYSTSILEAIVRSAGKECKGGAAAIICH